MMSEQKKNGVMRFLEVSAILFSVVTGFTSVSILVWKGGRMSQTVDTHENRITRIEANGSSMLVSHIALDDEREKQVHLRMTRLEEIFKTALEMRAEIAVIGQKVDDLRKQQQINK